MRFTTGQLRRAMLEPDNFVKQHLDTGSSHFPPYLGNPQPAWIDAALRAYFVEGRSPSALWDEFNERVSRHSSTSKRPGLRANAEAMLETMLDWDYEETKQPSLTQLSNQAQDVDWRGHILAIRLDLIYLSSGGYLIRQIWTKRELHPGSPEADLFAAAVFVCSESVLGPGRTEYVECWHLRLGNRRSWSRDEIQRHLDELERHLDMIDLRIAESTY